MPRCSRYKLSNYFSHPPAYFPPLVLATRVPALYMFRGSWLDCAVMSTAEGGGGVIHFRGQLPKVEAPS